MKIEPVFLYTVQCVCYCSSHDEFIATFSNEAKANEACNKLNAKEKQRLADLDKEPVETYSFPYDTPPYYVDKYDVTKWLGHTSGPEFNAKSLFKWYPKWKVIYSVPSLGEFIVFPVGCTAVEEYTLDEVKYE